MEQRETTNIRNKEEKRPTSFYTALQLASMYGVAETLDTIPFLPMEVFFHLIESWVSEYENGKEEDILSFFEGKMLQEKQGRMSY